MLKTARRLTFFGLIVVATVGLWELAGDAQTPSRSSIMPVFEVDPTWPKLPNDWVLGVVSSVTVDRRDHVWILHRPRNVSQSLKNRAAPPVLEFDAEGRFANAWGGPADGYDWPDNEHGITVDHKDNVWIGGSGATSTPPPRSDDMLLKFTNRGKFLMQIGARTQSRGNADTKNLNRPADVFVHAKTNEAFVADGYGNRRVIVFDADSGAFKRMWGGFGNPPDAAPPTPPGGLPRGADAPNVDTEGPGSPQFGIRVHGIKISNDGLVYVADRVNRRIQVFTTDGKYVTQAFINRRGATDGSVSGFAFSHDPQQQFLYVADFGNSHVVVVNRKTLEVLYQFGAVSAKPGDFQGPHYLAVDSKGTLYTAEVNPGNRAQRFFFKGLSSTPPPNALPAEQLPGS